MAGVKLGDRLLQLGAGDGRLFAALASKVGLTGRACVVDRDAEIIRKAMQAAEKAGVLIEPTTSWFNMLPFENESFDLVVVNQLLPRLAPYERIGMLREAYRVLRPGGRCLTIDEDARPGLGALLYRSGDRSYLQGGGPERSLTGEGFKASRKLAERQGLVFYEGVKPRVG
jgi:ubiquinone/menaquinone biosynthesis C-methylase UbiE